MAMKVKMVHYRRTKQVKRFEPEVLELQIAISGRTTVAEAVAVARATVAREFGETPTEEHIEKLRQAVVDFEQIRTFA